MRSFVDSDAEAISNLGNIGRACPNLKEIGCCTDDIPVSAFRDFVEAATPNLEYLCIYSKGNRQVWRPIGSLQFLPKAYRFVYVGPIPSPHPLRPFLAANQNMKILQLKVSFTIGMECIRRQAGAPSISETSILSRRRMGASLMAPFFRIRDP